MIPSREASDARSRPSDERLSSLFAREICPLCMDDYDSESETTCMVCESWSCPECAEALTQCEGFVCLACGGVESLSKIAAE